MALLVGFNLQIEGIEAEAESLEVPAEPNQKLVEIDDAVLVLVESTHGARNVISRPAKISAELSEASDVDESRALSVVTLEVLHSPLNDRVVSCIEHFGSIGVLPPGKELFEGNVARRRGGKGLLVKSFGCEESRGPELKER